MEGARSLNVSKFPGEPSAVMSEKLKFLNLGQCGAQKKKKDIEVRKTGFKSCCTV